MSVKVEQAPPVKRESCPTIPREPSRNSGNGPSSSRDAKNKVRKKSVRKRRAAKRRRRIARDKALADERRLRDPTFESSIERRSRLQKELWARNRSFKRQQPPIDHTFRPPASEDETAYSDESNQTEFSEPSDQSEEAQETETDEEQDHVPQDDEGIRARVTRGSAKRRSARLRSTKHDEESSSDEPLWVPHHHQGSPGIATRVRAKRRRVNVLPSDQSDEAEETDQDARPRRTSTRSQETASRVTRGLTRRTMNSDNAIEGSSKSPYVFSTESEASDEEVERIEYGPKTRKSATPVELETGSGVAKYSQQSPDGPAAAPTSASPVTVESIPGGGGVEFSASVVPVSKSMPTYYPSGGESYDKDGNGIFAQPDGEDSLPIWVDPLLNGRSSLLRQIESEGGRIATRHTDPETQLILLSPASTIIFDMYCHPEWLPPNGRRRYDKRQSLLKDADEPWQRRVLLKAWWVDKCIEAGRFLGEADDWAQCRAGGPPAGVSLDDRTPTQRKDVVMMAARDEPTRSIAPAESGEVYPPPEPINPTVSDTAPEDRAADVQADVEMHDVDVPANIPTDHEEETKDLPSGIQQESSSPDPDWLMASDDDPAPTKSGISPEGGSSGVETLTVVPSGTPPADPALLFEGCRFWIDPAAPGRHDLMRKLRTTKFKISTSYADATHVLIHDYMSTDWHGIVKTLAKRGIWSVRIQWARQCLKEGRHLPESAFVVPGGDISKNAEEEKAHRPRKEGGKLEASISSERLAEIFEQESKMIKEGGTIKAMSVTLVAKYGMYTEEYWRALYSQWTKKVDRFAYLADDRAGEPSTTRTPDASVTPTTQAQGTAPKPSKGPRMTVVEIAQCFLRHEEDLRQMSMYERMYWLAHTYGNYTPATWGNFWGEWPRRCGRFAGLDPALGPRLNPVPRQTTTTSLAKATRSPSVQTAVPKAAGSPSEEDGRVDVSLIEAKKIAAALQGNEKRIVTLGLTNNEAGDLLASEIGIYPLGTWAAYWDRWSKGQGRFGEIDPDLKPRIGEEAREAARLSAASKFSAPKPKRRVPYTAEEEKAMIDYIEAYSGPESKRSSKAWHRFAQMADRDCGT
ncbi:hypothetical protein IAU60_005074 [Kwoniella sp. DSM 27419]